MLTIFGLPIILHNANGKEFVNHIIKHTLLIWPGQCNIVSRNLGHSQSQGLVEQENRTIELKISAPETNKIKCSWSGWLPEIQCMCIVYLFTVYLCKSSAFI